MCVDSVSWVQRISREVREVQYLVVQQYLEHPIILGLTASADQGASRVTIQPSAGSQAVLAFTEAVAAAAREVASSVMGHSLRDPSIWAQPGRSRDSISLSPGMLGGLFGGEGEDADADPDHDDEDEDHSDSDSPSDDDDDDEHEDDDSDHTRSSSEREEPQARHPAPSSALPAIMTALKNQIKADALKRAPVLSEETCLVHNWCDSPLLMHGMFDHNTVFAPSEGEGQESAVGGDKFLMTCLSPLPADDGDMFTFPQGSLSLSQPAFASTLEQWALLRQLTDAPNGAGDAQRLVGLMKKYVREDQGSEAGPNHAVHATCAALIWHEGLAEEALGLVKSSKAGVDRRPSRQLQLVWKQSQTMRAVFPEDFEGNAEVTAETDADPLAAEADGEAPPAVIMNRQYSLPVQSQTLKPSTLAAVRRARLLLSYYPATAVTSLSSDTTSSPTGFARAASLDGLSRQGDGYFEALARDHGVTSTSPKQAKTAYKLGKSPTISDCVLTFIQDGPSPDLVRKVAEERSQLAELRAKGIALALELLQSSSQRLQKIEVLNKVAESIVCTSKIMRASSSSAAARAETKADDAIKTASEAKTKPKLSSLDIATFQFQGCHYSSGLSGCTRQKKATVEVCVILY